ncbi:hypothetical protein ARMSODRAFT_967034, partial [Armillaria solidipes]
MSHQSRKCSGRRWLVNTWTRLGGLRVLPKRKLSLRNEPSVSAVLTERRVSSSSSMGLQEPQFSITTEITTGTTSDSFLDSYLSPTPPPSPASSITGVTTGHTHELDPLPNLPSIQQLTVLGQTLLLIQAMPEVQLLPQVYLHPAECQHHITQICQAAFFFVQMLLAAASGGPLSANTVNVNELSRQLIKLAESWSFLELEVEYLLRPASGSGFNS